jgi:hypothetical protein
MECGQHNRNARLSHESFTLGPNSAIYLHHAWASTCVEIIRSGICAKNVGEEFANIALYVKFATLFIRRWLFFVVNIIVKSACRRLVEDFRTAASSI